MIILAIDTSGNSAGVALVQSTSDNYITLAECFYSRSTIKGSHKPSGKTHSETLMPMVSHVFELAGFKLADVDCIAATCGPGSFTGLRIGAATAKGLAYSAKKPLIAVPTLDALAYNATSIASAVYVIPMLDARREQAYSAVYCGKRLTGYLAEPVEEIINILYTHSKDGGHAIFLGDGAQNHRESITNQLTMHNQASDSVAMTFSFASCVHNQVRASHVGIIALQMFEDEAYIPPSEADFSLMYLRKPQAQREREERIARETTLSGVAQP